MSEPLARSAGRFPGTAPVARPGAWRDGTRHTAPPGTRHTVPPSGPAARGAA